MQTIDKIIKQLSAVSEKLNGDDRVMAAMTFKVHPETVNRYLRGEVKKEAFGLELLGFFKKRIADRETALA